MGTKVDNRRANKASIDALARREHMLDNRGRGKQPNKEAMGRKGVGGRPKEDSGEVSVGLVRRCIRDRRRTDISGWTELLVSVNHPKARSSQKG
ncbi:hypothetical protein BY996DRAFT_6538645 [Phakopsora pachyrhizi]|nr:hypothetical protein BY996DRAFT_6538645 [Phakopsora pachyrhizi]